MSEIKSNQSLLSDNPAKEYKHQQEMFSAQPPNIQHYLEVQGRLIAEAIVEGRSQVSFSLPDQIVCIYESMDRPALVSVPQQDRAYSSPNFMNRVRKVDLLKQLRQSLSGLEHSPDCVVSIAANLLRHAAVMHMVYKMLPAGRTMACSFTRTGETEQIAPDDNRVEPESRIAVNIGANTVGLKTREKHTQPLVPYVSYAERFYLPQWMAFDENGDLLVNSVEEAVTHIKSMQKFMEVVFLAAALAPYIPADEEYSQKRFGILDQLVNQGQALALFHTKEIIAFIKQRAASDNMNRGLSLSLPYFNDQNLRLDVLKIEIIPAGKVLFVPAFVVLAIRREEMKVSQDTRLNSSTRLHLLNLLERFRQAFETS